MNTPRTLFDASMTPSELWPLKQFVCWRYEHKPGRPKPDKIPVNPRTLGNAGATWPNTWTTIDVATCTYHKNDSLAGIGFVLTANDPHTMIDVDSCIVDGQLSALASEIIARLETYAEVSPSKTGVRLFVHCPQQPTMKKPEVEIYSSGRFATLTGNLLNDKPIARADNLDWLIHRFSAENQTDPHRPTKDPHLSFSHAPQPQTDDDKGLWDRIFAKNQLAYQLYSGNVQAARGDDSRAVILLLNSLALWTKSDVARMERMIKQTYLDKSWWDDKRGKTTWIRLNIDNAINYMAGKVQS